MTGDFIGLCPFCGCIVISEKTKDYVDNWGGIATVTHIWSAKHPFFHDPKKDNNCIGRNVNFQWFDTEEELFEAFNTRAKEIKWTGYY